MVLIIICFIFVRNATVPLNKSMSDFLAFTEKSSIHINLGGNNHCALLDSYYRTIYSNSHSSSNCILPES